VTPYTANGSLLKSSNGTTVGSALLAQNLTDSPWLFWPRPSLTDYSYFLGQPTPPAAVDPALVNVTLKYMALYGPYAVNASIPFSLVSASASSFDPDITPEAALVQIPRIANATNLSQTELMGFVLEHLITPTAGFLGTTYVNVLALDLALLPLEGK
jgi:potassium-transporting ATPase KdpC subunit